MFSSTKLKTTVPITKSTKQEKGYVVYSRFYNLPNRTILFMTSDSLQKTTSLKVFSIDDLHICLAEKHLEEVWRLLCIFPDGSILLNGREYQSEKTLLKLCPKSLDTLISQQWEGAFTAAVIDNDSFCIITQTDSQLRKGKRQRVLSTYTLTADSYLCASTTQLTHYPKNRFGDMDWVHLLRKNRFCCGIRENNTNEFKILIFEINLATHAVTELGIIQPAEQYFSYLLRGSGSFKVLSNGNILTQHECHDKVQIWDTEKLVCIQKWNWSDIKPYDKYFNWNIKITPFMDCLHLLLKKSTDLFIFNIEKQTIKKIALGCNANSYGENLILPNGQLLGFTQDISNSQVEIIHLDLKEMMHYRKILTESQHLVRLFFNRNMLPTEMTDHIFSYAFTADAKKQLAVKAAEEVENESSHRLVI